MNQANQKALCQQTNQGLLEIRQAEIDYYLMLNSTFGTQAALIGGFTYGNFAQATVFDDVTYKTMQGYVNDASWILSAITIACAIHVIISTMLIQVLGPGLALHGPVGSIVRATEGMRAEQRQIGISYIYMMIAFTCSTTLFFWVVMSFNAALGSTVVFAIAARYWYTYMERIYLRFYWDQKASEWREKDGDDDSIDLEGGVEDHEPGHNPMQNNNNKNSNRAKSLSFSAFSPRKAKGNNAGNGGVKHWHLPSFFSRSEKTGGHNNNQGNSSNNMGGIVRSLSTSSEMSAMGTPNSGHSSNGGGGSNGAFHHPKSYLHSGFLTKSTIIMSARDPTKEAWKRRYFVLHKNGALFLYTSRREYRDAPKNSLNLRPIMIEDYYVLVDTAVLIRIGDHPVFDDSHSVVSSMAPSMHSSQFNNNHNSNHNNRNGSHSVDSRASISGALHRSMFGFRQSGSPVLSPSARAVAANNTKSSNALGTSLLENDRYSDVESGSERSVAALQMTATSTSTSTTRSTLSTTPSVVTGGGVNGGGYSAHHSISGGGSVAGSHNHGVNDHHLHLDLSFTLVLKDPEEAETSLRWILRCDTTEELDNWVARLRQVSPGSFLS